MPDAVNAVWPHEDSVQRHVLRMAAKTCTTTDLKLCCSIWLFHARNSCQHTTGTKKEEAEGKNEKTGGTNGGIDS